jgi:cytosine/adenosine deaminase-related metal-dependent hydrolase
MSPLPTLLSFLALLLGAATSASASPAPVRQDIAIVGADVLPMAGPDRLRDQTVLISGDRITQVGTRARVRVPAGYKVINGAGRTVMPGLVDMHIHLSPEPGRPGDSTQRALAISLAHGITTARIMSGQPGHPAVRSSVDRGELAGPRLYAGSPPLHQNNIASPEAARAAVAAAKAAGFDLVKAHQLPNVEIWQAAQDEARRQGLPVAGHVANPVGLDRAMAAGQQVEHLDSAFLAFLAPGAPVNFGQFLPPHALDAAAGASDEDYAKLARKVAASQSWQVPTLAAFERLTDLGTPWDRLMALPDPRFVADWIVNQWRGQRDQLANGGYTPVLGARLAEVRRRLVRAYHGAGVKMMAGSDTPHPFHVWGSGMLREVEALSRAGLGPMAALRGATVVPRDYFRSLPNQGSAIGRKADFGTVEAGARADLILLARDPSVDVGNLRSLEAVIADGRLYQRAALDAMLAQAAKDGKAQPPPAPAPGN